MVKSSPCPFHFLCSFSFDSPLLAIMSALGVSFEKPWGSLFDGPHPMLESQSDSKQQGSQDSRNGRMIRMLTSKTVFQTKRRSLLSRINNKSCMSHNQSFCVAGGLEGVWYASCRRPTYDLSFIHLILSISTSTANPKP